jgi:hypothetical protein
MFVLVMYRCTPSLLVTLHATRAEAEKKIQWYARTGWEMAGEQGWHGEKDVNGCPTTIADCIKYLAGSCEYMHLFRADLGGGCGKEIVLVEGKTDSLDFIYDDEPALPVA